MNIVTIFGYTFPLGLRQAAKVTDSVDLPLIYLLIPSNLNRQQTIEALAGAQARRGGPFR